MRAGTRTQRVGIGIFGLLIAIFALRAVVDTPGLSLVFLAVFPIVMAAFVLGRTAREVEHHELFGEQAARDTLVALHGAPPADIVAGLRAAAVNHAGGRPADDLCLVAVRLGARDAAAQGQAA